MLAKIWLFGLVLPLTLALSHHLSPALTLILRISSIPMTMSPISLCLTTPFPLGTSFTSLYRHFFPEMSSLHYLLDLVSPPQKSNFLLIFPFLLMLKFKIWESFLVPTSPSLLCPDICQLTIVYDL